MGIQRFIEIITSFVVAAVTIRLLPREEYGLLSLVLGFGVFYNLINISLSSILLRDNEMLRPFLSEHMSAFFFFALLKTVTIVVCSIPLVIFLTQQYLVESIKWIVWLNVGVFIILFFSEPLNMILTVDFRQSVLTKVGIVTNVANFLLTFGLVVWPNAIFVAGKTLIVGVCGFILVLIHVLRIYEFKIVWEPRKNLLLIKKHLCGFSGWAHLIGVVTDWIYRADILILGIVGEGLGTIADYNIALQIANFSKLPAQILQQNATIGVGKVAQDKMRCNKLVATFSKISFCLSAITFAGYFIFGPLIIRLLTGTKEDSIFHFGLLIVGGLCLYNAMRPLASYAIIIGEIRQAFLFIFVPSGILTLIGYVITAIFWGAVGVAWANVLGAVFMTIFTLRHLMIRTDFSMPVRWIEEDEANYLRRYLGWLLGKKDKSSSEGVKR